METTRDTSLDAALLTAEEKQALHAAELPQPAQAPTQKKRKGIPPHLLVALIVTGLLVLGTAAGPRMTSCMRHHARPADAHFSQLLHSTDPETLRQVLADRLPEKYGKGVFPSDQEAVEAVHQDDAELATKIVRLAARQDDSNNSTDGGDETTDEPTTTKDEETTSEKPTETTTDGNDDESTTDKPTESASSGEDDETTSDDNESSKEDESKTEDKTSKTTTTDSDGTVATITSYADASNPTDDTDDSDDDGDADLQDAGARPAAALLPVLGAAAGAFFML